eukprot:TRINITY_DN4897_c0_g1_i1.p1 TRINITY_DN4897_c0_g1~~TRINITY_DN4897_c0_g1_i1.p1  ORF type:complete len:173 (-),score=35.99 TRINITY_DN4897_c0_g1_i1:418-906(-)
MIKTSNRNISNKLGSSANTHVGMPKKSLLTSEEVQNRKKQQKQQSNDRLSSRIDEERRKNAESQRFRDLELKQLKDQSKMADRELGQTRDAMQLVQEENHQLQNLKARYNELHLSHNQFFANNMLNCKLITEFSKRSIIERINKPSFLVKNEITLFNNTSER